MSLFIFLPFLYFIFIDSCSQLNSLPHACIPPLIYFNSKCLVTAEWAGDVHARSPSAPGGGASRSSSGAATTGSTKPAAVAGAAHFDEFDAALREDAELREAIALSLAEEERAAAARAEAAAARPGSSGAEL